MHSFGEYYFASLQPNQPVIEYLRELRGRGYKMALCTNNVREWEPLWRAKLPVDEIFDVVVDSGFRRHSQAGAAHLRTHPRAPRRDRDRVAPDR